MFVREQQVDKFGTLNKKQYEAKDTIKRKPNKSI